jgi:putative FmdB family regulatory protein
MPLYDYRCHLCGETFEVRQKFADAVLTVHENCGGELERLISLPALQFKGTGWYVTDYGRNGNSPAPAGGKAETTSDSKSDSTSESKSEAKSETKSSSAGESKNEAKSEAKPTPVASAPSK